MYSTQVDSTELLESMQGRWRTIYSEIDGQVGPEESDHFLIYKEDKFTVEKGGKPAHEGRFSLNASQRPWELVYIYSKSFPIYLGGPRAGILQLEGNTLKCCFALLGHPAPRDFNTFPGSQWVLTVHERFTNDKAAPRVFLRTRPPWIVVW
jgi:uncharacterized protein (TIGR03067 family)